MLPIANAELVVSDTVSEIEQNERNSECGEVRISIFNIQHSTSPHFLSPTTIKPVSEEEEEDEDEGEDEGRDGDTGAGEPGRDHGES